MNNRLGKVYNLKITTLSPIHVGDNVDFQTSNYVICDENESKQDAPAANTGDKIVCDCGYVNLLENVKKNPYCWECGAELEIPASHAPAGKGKSAGNPYLYTFTPKQLAETLTLEEKRKLLEVARTGSYKSLGEFFKEKSVKIAQNAFKHSRVCPKVYETYMEKFGNSKVEKGKENQFRIEKNISDSATDIAYIPGSSLKGAFRTALMTAQNHKRPTPFTYKDAEGTDKHGNKKYSAKKIEQQLYDYKDQTQDPFKYLKIGDTVSAEDYFTEICVAGNYGRNSFDDEVTLPVFMEVIPEGTIFKSQLCIADKFADDINAIKKACNKFYGDIMSMEKSYINLKDKSQFYAGLEQAAQKPNAFVIRLGKHGGAENVTIDTLRRIRVNHGMNKDKNGGEKKIITEILDHATTYWLADNGKQKLPFGWCLVEYEEVK